MHQTTSTYYKRDFWASENLKYAKPHFRMEKAARLINNIAGKKQCDLLDVGCGPAALAPLLSSNINYYGVDLAIHSRDSNLLECDFVENPISWKGRTFDIVLAQGVFEYIGSIQAQKFAEIKSILKPGGIFITSYVNFDHVRRVIYEPYNNVQPSESFRNGLSRHFDVKRIIPTSHHWRHREPARPIMKRIHMHWNTRIPFLTSRLAIEYFFVCSRP
ncbi:MAG TPA: class I SAM-dependent methyltransferase [Bryobacteraceae bacterium]|nr:class I SAM-dependent methyltransferase [Bryobacteraceae bacterium]